MEAGLVDELIEVKPTASSQAAAKKTPIAACAASVVGFSPTVTTMAMAQERKAELVSRGIL